MMVFAKILVLENPSFPAHDSPMNQNDNFHSHKKFEFIKSIAL